jgi:hypothetical protein
MNNEVTTPKSFEERMIEQFRANIGNLMTDDEMRKIIERGMENLFFTPKMEKSKSYPYEEQLSAPPLAYQIAEKMFREAAEAVLMRWMVDNKERMFELLEKQLCNENLQSLMLQMFSQMFTSPILSANEHIKQRVTQFAFQNNLNPGALHG